MIRVTYGFVKDINHEKICIYHISRNKEDGNKIQRTSYFFIFLFLHYTRQFFTYKTLLLRAFGTKVIYPWR